MMSVPYTTHGSSVASLRTTILPCVLMFLPSLCLLSIVLLLTLSLLLLIADQVNEYSHLFKTEEPSDAQWEAELNPLSRVIKPNALVDPSIFAHAPHAELHVQFERLGFYVIDRYTSAEACTPEGSAAGQKMTFNLTVLLKDSKPKAAGAPSRSRKEEQAAQLAEKMVGRCLVLCVLSRLVSCCVSYLVLSCSVCLVLSCLVLWVLSRLVLSCAVCLVLSCAVCLVCM
jgi:hypothetical protein